MRRTTVDGRSIHTDASITQQNYNSHRCQQHYTDAVHHQVNFHSPAHSTTVFSPENEQRTTLQRRTYRIR